MSIIENVRIYQNFGEAAQVRRVQVGDLISFDMEADLDSECFPGEKHNYSGMRVQWPWFFEEIERVLVGLKVGDTCRVEFHYPEPYYQKEVAGKKAIYDVTITEIIRDE